MFYNELSAKYLFWTCQGIYSAFFRYFRKYLVAASTCFSHKWPRYVVSLFQTRTPLHVLLRSPVEAAENSCGNNCWIQPTNKFNQNKFYRRCSMKGTEQCNFIKCLDSDYKEKKENVLLHREIGRLQVSFSLQQLTYSVAVSWFVLLSLT